MLNLRAIKEHLERYFLSGYQHAYLDGRLISKRLQWSDITSSPTRYIDLLRLMGPLFNVKVLRNEHSIDEGIYFVGRERLCEKSAEVFIHIVRVVEAACYDFNHKDDSLHATTEKSKYKGKIILKFEKMIQGIQKDYTAYAKIRQIQEKEIADQVSFISYIKGYSHLRNKTPLRWEQ